MKADLHSMTPSLRDVFDGIRSEPGRAGLSFLAVMIGITALTVLLAFLGGLREKARLLVKDLGANVVAIVPSESLTPDDRPVLDRAMVEVLKKNMDTCRVSAVLQFELPVEGMETPLPVFATDETLHHLRGWSLCQGRFLDHWDVINSSRSIVITRALGQTYDWNLGSVIFLDHVPFTVVGVIDSLGGAADHEAVGGGWQTGRDAVFVPFSACRTWGVWEQDAYPAVDAIFLQSIKGEDAAEVVKRAQWILREPGYATRSLSWITPELVIRGIRRLQNSVRLAGGSIAVLCLILGGTTLMSLMVANVRDRIMEIGLRRALGATAGQVAILFVLESCLVTGIAALAGTVAACLLVWFTKYRFSAPVEMGGTALILPVLVSLVLGFAFSYWPAQMAARVSPAEALRND